MGLRKLFLTFICLIGLPCAIAAGDDTPFALGQLDSVAPAGGGFSKSGIAIDGWRVSGQVALTFYPLHNEFDPNFGVPFKQSDAARYSLATDVTVTRPGIPLFFRLYDSLVLGRTFPQLDYNYDPTPILLEMQPTLGWEFNRNLDARVTFDQSIDLGHFTSHNQVTPWLALSARLKTDQPVNLFNAMQLSGYGEFSLFMPGLEYPATPGASPQNPPDLGFSPDEIVNARYGVTLEASLRPTARFFDRFFIFGAPEFFFGDSTAEDRDSFGASPLSVLFKAGIGYRITPDLDLRITRSQYIRMSGAPRGLARELYHGISLVYGF
jgi:hypothetical protein